MISKLIAACVFVVWLFSATTVLAQTSQWRPVSGNRRDNISGMALIEQAGDKISFFIVNDNKKPEQNHVALLSIEGRAAPKYTPLRWIGEEVPTDLEAITAVPSTANNFMMLTAAGRVFHVELDRQNNSVRVLKSFDVPSMPSDHDFEAFALQKVGSLLLAVWADRGLGQKPAQIFWSRFDFKTAAFSHVGSAKVNVPFSTENTRHISDVKVDGSGAVFITSASDPGNDGPFASAVYFAGTFNICNSQQITFVQPSQLVRLFRFDHHKVEALELVLGARGGLVFGTDDENLGAAIYFDW